MRPRGRGPGADESRLGLLQRIVNVRRAKAAEGGATALAGRGAESPTDDQPRLQRLEQRIDHLEAALEGLQDAVHREAVRHHEEIADLRKKVEPEAMARALSDDARQRGL